MSSYTNRVVVLVDMDCFYCQVEEKLDPKLAGKPLAVVQYNAWRGGGIIAVNYPARERGVSRHMRGNEAKKKCPEIILVQVPNVRGKADLSKYREAGKRVAEVLQTFSVLLERASVDEAYLDITEVVNKRISTLTSKLTVDQLPNTHIIGSECKDFLCNIYSNEFENESNVKLAVGATILEEIRAAVYEKTGYTCSAGIAHNKILAKLACGLHKPNKQTILPQDGIEEFYKKLPLKKVRSLGGKFGVSLSETLNITYMGELIKFSMRDLQNKYDEKTAHWLFNIARGINKEAVLTRLISKSIGCCKKFPGKTALIKPEAVIRWLSELAEEISERLEQDAAENNRRAKQMTVSFAVPINRKDVHSSKVQTLNSYDAKKIATDAFEILKKMAQNPDGTFKLTFLGLNVGKFEDCKNVSNISNFFKSVVKSEFNTQENKTLEQNNSSKIKKESNINFLRSNSQSDKTNIKDKKYFSGVSENIRNIKQFNVENKEELNLDEIEEDAEQSLDIDFNKTIQDIQNLKYLNEASFSDSTIEEDYTEEISKRQEFPYFSGYSATENFILEQKLMFGDTSKSFFMKYLNNLDYTNKSALPQKIMEPDAIKRNIYEDSNNSLIMDETENINKFTKKVEIKQNMFEIPSCSKETSNNIIKVDDDNNSSANEKENICPECNKKIPFYDYILHMDHHMAEKLMAEEKLLFQHEFQAMKQKQITKTVKTKSVKRKSTAVENNCSIESFLKKVTDVNKEIKITQCPECDKKIPVNDYACHLDFHAAKKLHLELNPVNVCSTAVNIDKIKKSKNVKSGMLGLSNYFKTVGN